jgi:transcriptional regulator with XRE-family HTH domain
LPLNLLPGQIYYPKKGKFNVICVWRKNVVIVVPLPSMHTVKEEVARLVKGGRISKGYTQQELSELTGISLRSVQRIENGDVLPRMYTLKILAKHLDFSLEQIQSDKNELKVAVHQRTNKTQRIILTFGTGIVILLLTGAFVAQSPKFPETQFESFLLTAGVLVCYVFILFRIWK